MTRSGLAFYIVAAHLVVLCAAALLFICIFC